MTTLRICLVTSLVLSAVAVVGCDSTPESSPETHELGLPDGGTVEDIGGEHR
jgi:hypothetical protein